MNFLKQPKRYNVSGILVQFLNSVSFGEIHRRKAHKHCFSRELFSTFCHKFMAER